MNIDTYLHFLEVAILAVGAFLAIHQLKLQHQELHTDSLREHRRQSMEIDARLAEFANERHKIEQAFPPSNWISQISIEQLQLVFASDIELEPSLLKIIEQMEMLALPVCAKAADEDMAFELVGTTMVSYTNYFRSYIEHRRLVQNRPDFYIYLTSLVDLRWAERDVQERRLLANRSVPFFLR